MMLGLFRALAGIALVLFIITMPTDGVEGVMTLGGVSLLKIAGGALFALSVLLFVMGWRFVAFPWFQLTFLLALSWMILSYTWSPVVVSYSDPAEIPQVLKVNFHILLLVLLLTQLVRTGRDLEWLYLAFVVGNLWLVYLLLKTYPAAGDIIRHEIEGVDGNEASVKFAMVIPFAVYLVLASRVWLWRALALAYIPLAAYATLITGSRTGAVCLVVGVFSLLALWKKLGVVERLISTGIALSLAVVVVTAVPPQTLDRIFTIGQEVSSGSLNSRSNTWKNAYREWAASPIYGHGLDAFKRVMNKHNVEYIGHNSYISIALEQGAIGLLLYLLVIGVAFWTVFFSRLPLDGQLLLYAMLAVVLIGQLTLDLQDRMYIWMAYAIAVLHAAVSTAAVARQGEQ